MRSDRRFLQIWVSGSLESEERKDALVDIAALEDGDVLLDGIDEQRVQILVLLSELDKLCKRNIRGTAKQEMRSGSRHAKAIPYSARERPIVRSCSSSWSS